jgi:hypothetical protein
MAVKTAKILFMASPPIIQVYTTAAALQPQPAAEKFQRSKYGTSTHNASSGQDTSQGRQNQQFRYLPKGVPHE